MNIDGVSNGIVLDHITAGCSMKIYKYLHLDDLSCSVAVIKNVRSNRLGKKDIIKIDSDIDLDMAVLGYVDPNITVNIIKNNTLAEKRSLSLPETLVNIIKCKNPRCITTTEQEIDHIFKLVDRESKLYRCIYCDTLHK